VLRQVDLRDYVSERQHDARLPRHKRLLQAADFSHVFQKPARSTDACFSVAARPRRGERAETIVSARLGLAISRKALPRAVDRNRIKRVVRESFRRMSLCPGVDFVVVARTGLRDADKAAVRRSIDAHFAVLRGRLCARRKDG
jgi:ribonuclease P protein component